MTGGGLASSAGATAKRGTGTCRGGYMRNAPLCATDRSILSSFADSVTGAQKGEKACRMQAMHRRVLALIEPIIAHGHQATPSKAAGTPLLATF